MSQSTPYNFEGANVRALEIDGGPYFVGKDVAATLGYRRKVPTGTPLPSAIGGRGGD